jgi:uncharacterized tellurite resistance protein B-like protein
MDRTDLLRNLFIMALADGKISPEELNLIAEHRNQWGMSEAQFEATLCEAQSPQAQLHFPDDPDECSQLLADMAAVMAADGRFTTLEKSVFALAAVKMNIDAEELEDILDLLSDDDELLMDSSD